MGQSYGNRAERRANKKPGNNPQRELLPGNKQKAVWQAERNRLGADEQDKSSGPPLARQAKNTRF
jgi:hypothetical protein